MEAGGGWSEGGGRGHLVCLGENIHHVADLHWIASHLDFVSRFGLAVRQAEAEGKRLVSGRTSVRYRFGSPFSSERLWFVDTVL